MILDYIRQYDFATKTNIDHLVLDILPAVLDEKQKANKVRNLIYALSKRDKYIENQGTVRYPKWALTSSKLQNQDEL
jgi:ATP-dependent DNA helicase RecG